MARWPSGRRRWPGWRRRPHRPTDPSGHASNPALLVGVRLIGVPPAEQLRDAVPQCAAEGEEEPGHSSQHVKHPTRGSRLFFKELVPP
jgi:hypothetical protein